LLLLFRVDTLATNSTEQSPYNSRPPSQEITCGLRNPKVHYDVYKISLLYSCPGINLNIEFKFCVNWCRSFGKYYLWLAK